MNHFRICFFVVLLFSTMNTSPQQLTLRFPDTTAIPGQVNIHVYLSGTAVVSSFDLMFKYWNFIASFPVIQNVNPLVSDSLVVDIMPGDATDWVKIHWSGIPLVNLCGNTLFDLELLYYGGYTTLEWLDWSDTLCVFYDPLGNIIPTTFVNGSIDLLNGINQPTQPDVMRVFPKPCQDGKFTIEFAPLVRDGVIRINDMYGNTVNSANVKQGSTSVEFDGNGYHFSKGVYCVILESGGLIRTDKIIIF